MIACARSFAAIVAMALLLVACDGESRATTEAPRPSNFTEPPPLVLSSGDSIVRLQPYSYCWRSNNQNVCADGTAPEPPPLLHVTAPVELAWPITGWTFRFSSSAEPDCPAVAVSITAQEQFFPFGCDRISIFATGPEGDASFAIRIESDLPPTNPRPQVTWVFNPLDSGSGPEFYVDNWPDLTADVSAVVEVRTGDGNEANVVASVQSSERSIFIWLVQPLVEVGEPPYAMVVRIVADSETYISGPIIWPDDFAPGGNEGPITTLRPLE